MRHVRDPENICAALLIVAFFLPWINIFGFNVAGYQFHELESGAGIVWAIPVLSLMLIVLGFLDVRRVWMSVVTGLLPLAGLLYLVADEGGEVFAALKVGAYLTLLAGFALIAAAAATRTKRRAAAGPTPEGSGRAAE